MKTKIYILAFFAFCAIPSLFAQQTLSSLTEGCVKFMNEQKAYDPGQVFVYPELTGTEEPTSIYTLAKILNVDVYSYYKLYSYKTDLQKQVYQETDEYKKQYAELKAKSEQLKKTPCYYIGKLDKNYDVNRKGFPYTKEIHEWGFPKCPGYFVQKDIAFEFATKRFPKNKVNVTTRTWGRDTYYKQEILLPVADPNVALKIEENAGSVGVLFLFTPNSFYEQSTMVSVLLARTTAIYLVNTRTGEVYCKVL